MATDSGGMKPAETLDELFRTAQPEMPLQPDDPRYVPDIEGREAKGGSPLRRLEVTLRQHIANHDADFAKLVFTGHRGAGKTTELLRLEQRLAESAYVVHLEMDESLRADFDYTLMLLWLAEGLVERLAEDGIHLDQSALDSIGGWFAEVSRVEIDKSLTEGEASLQSSAGGKAGLFGFGVSLMAKLQARLLSSREDRLEVRTRMQQRGSELIRRINQLLIEAAQALQKADKPAAIVVVQDNLDRLERDVAARLFCDNGELLKGLSLHLILTAPLALTLAPDRIATVFPQSFTLPTPKLRTRDGDPLPTSLAALRQVVLHRASPELFEADGLIDALVEASGGSFRDLIRLLRQAQIEAKADEATRIGGAHVQGAIAQLRASLVQALQPAAHYFPALVEVQRTKDAPLPGDEAEAAAARDFLRELIYIGAVLEYNGDDYWYDVQPTLLQARRYRDAERDAGGR